MTQFRLPVKPISVPRVDSQQAEIEKIELDHFDGQAIYHSVLFVSVLFVILFLS